MNETNQYSYIEKIHNQYVKHEVTKIDELRNLDKKAKRPANIFSYIFGILGSLVFGVGMCLSMQVIGSELEFGFALGIIIGVLGIAMVSINYFIYKAVLESGKNKYSHQITEITKELLNK